MSDFKDRLWRDLLRDHRGDLEPLIAPSARLSRRRRPRILAGTTVGLAGAGTVIALALGAANSSPAFAVNRNSDGTISVMIIRPAGIRGANARLATLGIHVRAVEVMAGCAAPAPPALTARRLAGRPSQARVTWVHIGVVTRIDPHRIPPGRTLVLATQRAAGKVQVVTAHAVIGQAPRCLPPLPNLPLLGPGSVQCIANGSAVPPALADAATATSSTGTGTGTTTTGTGTGTGTTTTGTGTGTGTTTTASPSPPPPSHFRRTQCQVVRPRPGTSTTGTGTTGTGTTTTGSTGTGTTGTTTTER